MDTLNSPNNLEKKLEFRNGIPVLDTVTYEIVAVDSVNKEIQDFIDANGRFLLRLLGTGTPLSLGESRSHSPLSFGIIYPEDASGKESNENNENGIIRVEELMTFISKDDTGNIVYMARSRQEGIGVNTPGALDPGVFSHGGLKQAGVVNGWRFIADSLNKDDTSLEEEVYEKHLKNSSFPEVKRIINFGSFIIANGSNARNEKNTKEGGTLEIRTSGMLHIRGLLVNFSDFQDLLTKQNKDSNLIRYTSLKLSDSPDTFSPKHTAVHGMFQKLDLPSLELGGDSVSQTVSRIISL